jgi:thiamine-phosphate diphosphorylase
MPAEAEMRGFGARLGLYVITSDNSVLGRSHADIVVAACAGGADAVQLRAPGLAGDDAATLASQLCAICRKNGVLFIVNDSGEVALRSGADGLHLGQLDDPWRARERLGPGPVLGISVSDLGQAVRAEQSGADYVAVTVWPTATKPEARGVGLDGLAEIAARSRLPVVGIGGIDAANAAQVLAAGAAGVAVISAVGGAPDPLEATRKLRRAVDDAMTSRT